VRRSLNSKYESCTRLAGVLLEQENDFLILLNTINLISPACKGIYGKHVKAMMQEVVCQAEGTVVANSLKCRRT
jgi:hypothetical protein